MRTPFVVLMAAGSGILGGAFALFLGAVFQGGGETPKRDAELESAEPRTKRTPRHTTKSETLSASANGQAAAADPAEPAASASPRNPELDVPPEEERRFEEERTRLDIETARAEPVDPAWARSAQAGLESNLMKLGSRGGFHIDRTECRTTRCLADVTFPNRVVARRAIDPIIHELYEPNCAVAIQLPPGEGEMKAVVRFNCEGSRIATLSTGEDTR
jgi:hypothetical protein